MSEEKPREIALQVLGRRTRSRYVEDLLESALAQGAGLSSPDRRLCQELVYGIVRWQAALDFLITRKTPGRSTSPALMDFLRLGLYQIFWLDRIPEHAAVHETVELAKRRGFGRQAGFINAVLRGYLREQEPVQSLLTDLKTREPEIGYSHPNWLIQRWQARWGRDKTAQLLEWNNTPPKTFARVNTLKVHPEKLLPQWREENVEYEFFRGDWVEENSVFELKAHPPLSRLPSFQQGFFYVQDPSTLLAVRRLDPQPGERSLDLCAAPGGKLTYAAQLLRNEGRIIAHDTARERLKLIQENCARLGVTCVTAVDPAGLDREPHGSFDRVLLDAPCSNTGVMRRRVDLRWRIQLEEIGRLREVQKGLLTKAFTLLKPGGLLVYSTCSLEPEENAELVREFAAAQPSAKVESERELLPFQDGVDGAYVARIRR